MNRSAKTNGLAAATAAALLAGSWGSQPAVQADQGGIPHWIALTEVPTRWVEREWVYPTATPVPLSNNIQEPSSTPRLEPTRTAVLVDPTFTPRIVNPTATSTRAVISPTSAPLLVDPTFTPTQAVSAPTATRTAILASTSTALPTRTSTPLPTRTPTSVPTATRVPPTPTPAPSLDLRSSEELQLIDLINTSRASVGARRLSIEERVMDVARWRAADMDARHYSGHLIPAGACYAGRCWSSSIYVWDVLTAAGVPWAHAAENLWQAGGLTSGFAEVANEVFLDSSAHRSAMLDPQWTHVGTGIAPYRWSNGNHVVEIFVRLP